MMAEEADDVLALVEALDEMTWWMFDTTCVGMGAYRQFDYTMIGNLGRDLSPRLGDCYYLAMQAFVGWERFSYHQRYRRSLGQEPEPVASATDLPKPVGLVHGTIHHRDEQHRIGHAWVVLDNGDVWEPITGLICHADLFEAYAQARTAMLYNETQARINMLRSQHYGPWHPTDEKGNPT